MKPARRLLPLAAAVAGLLSGLGLDLRGQDVPGGAPGTQEAPPPSPYGFVPQQYVPAYVPAPGMDATVPAPQPGAVSTNAPSADEEEEPAPAFRTSNVAPRMDGSPTSGFAPVVGALPPEALPQLALHGGGVARAYAPGFRLGGFDIRPDLQFAGTYNDNIYLVPKSVPKTADYIISVTPRVDANWNDGGDSDPDSTSFDINYAPAILEFLDNPGNSALNQSVNAQVVHRFSKLRVALSQSYSHVSGGIIEAGDLVNQDYYTTFLDLNYTLTPKSSLDWTSSYAASRYTVGVDSDQFFSQLYFNYLVRPKVTVGFAPYLSLLMPQNSANQYAAGGMMRADYAYSEKTDFFAQIGVGERFFSGFSSHSDQEWTYQLGSVVMVGPKTALSVSSSRQTNGSALDTNSDYVDTNLGIALQQVLLRGVVVSFTGSYDHAEYFSTITDASQETYDYYSISPAISYRPTAWSTIGATYLYRQNLSNIAAREFTNNQVTLFTTINF